MMQINRLKSSARAAGCNNMFHPSIRYVQIRGFMQRISVYRGCAKRPPSRRV